MQIGGNEQKSGSEWITWTTHFFFISILHLEAQSSAKHFFFISFLVIFTCSQPHREVSIVIIFHNSNTCKIFNKPFILRIFPYKREYGHEFVIFIFSSFTSTFIQTSNNVLL